MVWMERLPKKIVFQVGGFFHGFTAYTLSFTAKGAKLVQEHSLQEGASLPQILTTEEAQQLKEQFSAIHTENWKPEYFDSDIVDGEQWDLTVRFTDGMKLKHEGSNAYPKNWSDLLGFFESAAITARGIMNKSNFDIYVEVGKEMKKITADYDLMGVLFKFKMFNRANMDFYFTNAWECIPSEHLYANWIAVLSDCARANYRRMFNPRLIEKLREVNKHTTVDNPVLKGRLDDDGLLTIYHGHAKPTMTGSYSWTTEPEIAHFFGGRNAKHMGLDDYYIVSGKVRLEDVIAHITDRSEEEVVVLNKDVKRKIREIFKRNDDEYSNFDGVLAIIARRNE